MFSCYRIITHIRHSSYRHRTIIRHRSFIWFCESPEVFERCLNNSYIIRLISFSNFVDMKIYIKLNERKKCIMQWMYNFKLYLNALWKNLNAMLCARLHSSMGSIRSIDTFLLKVSPNVVRKVSTCIDADGWHFQHLLIYI